MKSPQATSNELDSFRHLMTPTNPDRCFFSFAVNNTRTSTAAFARASSQATAQRDMDSGGVAEQSDGLLYSSDEVEDLTSDATEPASVAAPVVEPRRLCDEPRNYALCPQLGKACNTGRGTRAPITPATGPGTASTRTCKLLGRYLLGLPSLGRNKAAKL